MRARRDFPHNLTILDAMNVAEALQSIALKIFTGFLALIAALNGLGTAPVYRAPLTKMPSPAVEIVDIKPLVNIIEEKALATTYPKTQKSPPAEKTEETEEKTVATTPTTKPEQPAQAAAPAKIEQNIVVALPPPPIIVPLPFTEVNARTRDALVNILCTTGYGGSLNPISASGVIIDPRGVVVTNAHVAQYFLLKDYPIPGNIQCVLRLGSPAQPKYVAELLLVSPQWVRDNAAMIVSQDPTGTGENDYAFLRIIGTTNPNGTLPSSFSYIEPDAREGAISVGDQALTAGYPAGFLGGIAIQRELYVSSSVTPVREMFTFETFGDLFSIGGSVVAQKGASGGAVVNARGKLVGVIVTSTDSDTTGGRDLRAITLAHIDRSLARYAATSFSELLGNSLASSALDFQTGTAPTLTRLLTDYLDRQ